MRVYLAMLWIDHLLILPMSSHPMLTSQILTILVTLVLAKLMLAIEASVFERYSDVGDDKSDGGSTNDEDDFN